MKALDSRCTGIQMDPTPGFYGLHEEKVAVPTHKDIGPMRHEPASNALGIAARPATNVGHPYAATSAFQVLMLWKIPPDQLIVNVSVNCDKGFDGGYRVGHPEISDVPGVPNFIAGTEVMEDPVVDVTMGIAEQSYAHDANFGVLTRLDRSWRSVNEHG